MLNIPNEDELQYPLRTEREEYNHDYWYGVIVVRGTQGTTLQGSVCLPLRPWCPQQSLQKRTDGLIVEQGFQNPGLVCRLRMT